MIIKQLNIDTTITFVTVLEIYTMTNTTQTTVMAVKDWFIFIITE